MNKVVCNTIIALLLVAVASLALMLRGFEKEVDCTTPESFSAQRYRIDEGFQTSASYLTKLAQLDSCSDPKNLHKQQIFAMVKDIEIKSNSYAFINKLFFWLSLTLAVIMLLIPIVHSASEREGLAYTLSNPVQLPAIVVLAGLCFALYGDYKQKQTGAENLIRYCYFSKDEIDMKSETVRKGLAEIDRGHDFSALLQQ